MPRDFWHMSMPDRKQPDSGAATAFFDIIAMEPRLTRIADFSRTHLVVRGELPDAGSDSYLPRLMVFQLAANGSWGLQDVVSGHTGVNLADGRVAYASGAGAGSSVWISAGAETNHLVHRLQGRIAAMVCGGDGTDIYCLSQHIGAARPAEANGDRMPGAMLFTDRFASIGKTRSKAGAWQLVRLDAADGRHLWQTDLAFEPTGEISVMGNGNLLVGAVVQGDCQDGRFGFIRLGPDGREIARYLDKKTSYFRAVSDLDGAKVVCAGVCVADPPGGLRQRLVVLSQDGSHKEVRVSDELWHQPVGFCNPRRLVTLAEDRGRRKLFLHDLDRATSDCLAIDGSVLDAKVIGDKLACITSSLSKMPSLQLFDMAGDAGITTVLGARALDLGGSLHDVSQSIDKDLSLASRICRPDRPEMAGLVVMFHGGPCKTWADWPWRWNPWPFVQAGFAVVLPDPPMSVGYGDRAIDLGWKRWRTGIARHAARQVEMLRDVVGLAHKPLILMGGSFGGYLALATAEQLLPDLVICHGAPADLRQVALTSDVPWQWIREYGAPDLSNSDYRRESLCDFAKMKGRRVVLSHGLNDDLVPVSHAVGLYRCLQSDGVDAALAIFDNEHHGLARISNQQEWFRWIVGETVAIVSAENRRAP
ncbi:alpha/beta fold hydrolase [Bradyrhizobium pachyrhizi]|uniref:alpha/beta hydrolase family protein n=1 Tax=Bradyrhizobium pachyrhizi TaxID=280333 RepID=UPI0024B0A59A|nr:alpha/beta fold hydrolase [Bradyrhizobium pachyrhizi]WFU53625.1 alpha/beta fold hydrolase [Bradyrhizobium pachyrhizi]